MTLPPFPTPWGSLDLETTGRNPRTARIVEMCVRRHEDGTVNEWVQRFNPGVPIEPGATEKHKITNEAVANEPPFSQFVEHAVCMLTGLKALVSYNGITFDTVVLINELARCGVLAVPWDGTPLIDGYRAWQKLQKRSLEAAYEHWCGKVLAGAHGAVPDTRATEEVLGAMLELYPDLPRDPAALEKHFLPDDADQWAEGTGRLLRDAEGHLVFGFGYHRDERVAEVCANDADYMARLIFKATDFSPRVIELLTAEAVRAGVSLWACAEGKALRRPDGEIVLGMGEKQGHKGKTLRELAANDERQRGSGRSFLKWILEPKKDPFPDDFLALVAAALNGG